MATATVWLPHVEDYIPTTFQMDNSKRRQFAAQKVKAEIEERPYHRNKTVNKNVFERRNVQRQEEGVESALMLHCMTSFQTHATLRRRYFVHKFGFDAVKAFIFIAGNPQSEADDCSDYMVSARLRDFFNLPVSRAHLVGGLWYRFYGSTAVGQARLIFEELEAEADAQLMVPPSMIFGWRTTESLIKGSGQRPEQSGGLSDGRLAEGAMELFQEDEHQPDSYICEDSVDTCGSTSSLYDILHKKTSIFIQGATGLVEAVKYIPDNEEWKYSAFYEPDGELDITYQFTFESEDLAETAWKYAQQAHAEIQANEVIETTSLATIEQEPRDVAGCYKSEACIRSFTNSQACAPSRFWPCNCSFIDCSYSAAIVAFSQSPGRAVKDFPRQVIVRDLCEAISASQTAWRDNTAFMAVSAALAYSYPHPGSAWNRARIKEERRRQIISLIDMLHKLLGRH